MTKKKEKTIRFKYIEEDGATLLGAPDDIKTERGNYRDGGCMFKFTTSDASIGFKERFALYLYAEDIRELTLKVWKAYLETEPKRAREDFKDIFFKIELLAKED